MPWGDRTGPMGRGPMTGRAAGYCAGYNVPGYANAPGFGRGPGLGRGLGRGRWFWGRQAPPAVPAPPAQAPPAYGYGYAQPASMSKEQESKILEAEKSGLESEIAEIQEEIKQINKRVQELRKS
jgi:hypothetical protein